MNNASPLALAPRVCDRNPSVHSSSQQLSGCSPSNFRVAQTSAPFGSLLRDSRVAMSRHYHGRQRRLRHRQQGGRREQESDVEEWAEEFRPAPHPNKYPSGQGLRERAQALRHRNEGKAFRTQNWLNHWRPEELDAIDWFYQPDSERARSNPVFEGESCALKRCSQRFLIFLYRDKVATVFQHSAHVFMTI